MANLVFIIFTYEKIFWWLLTLICVCHGSENSSMTFSTQFTNGAGITSYKAEYTLYFNTGTTVLLNCSCHNESNSQWLGQTRHRTEVKDNPFMPYSQGLKLNPFLKNSNVDVIGGYDDGQCSLEIRHFSVNDEGVYICHTLLIDEVRTHIYHLMAKKNSSMTFSTQFTNGESPRPPRYFTVIADCSTLVLHWHSGFNGGIQQAFYITYRSNENAKPKIFGPIYDTCMNNRSMFYVIHNVSASTTHFISLYAENKAGRSQEVNVVVNTYRCTPEEDRKLKMSYWILSGTVIGALVLALISSHWICIFVRRKRSYSIHQAPLQAHYDEIGTINYNMVDIGPLPAIPTNGEIDNIPEPTVGAERRSNSSSQKSEISEPMVGDGYENPYQPLQVDLISTHNYDDNVFPPTTSTNVSPVRGTDGNVHFDSCENSELETDVQLESDCSRTSSEESSVLGKNDGYEHPYKPLQMENTEPHAYDTCTIELDVQSNIKYDFCDIETEKM